MWHTVTHVSKRGERYLKEQDLRIDQTPCFVHTTFKEVSQTIEEGVSQY